MKKTYQLTHEKITKPRLVDAIKHDVKKYIKRERNKKLADGVDFLDFDCKYGKDELTADIIHMSALNKSIDHAAGQDLESFYIEIISKPGYRTAKPASDIFEEE
jgi:hypothetical protein